MTTVGTRPVVSSGRYSHPRNVTPSSVLNAISLRMARPPHHTSSGQLFTPNATFLCLLQWTDLRIYSVLALRCVSPRAELPKMWAIPVWTPPRRAIRCRTMSESRHCFYRSLAWASQVGVWRPFTRPKVRPPRCHPMAGPMSPVRFDVLTQDEARRTCRHCTVPVAQEYVPRSYSPRPFCPLVLIATARVGSPLASTTFMGSTM